MPDICPNINTKEWKLMIKHLNGDIHEVYRAFMAHGNTIPNAVPMSELKKTIRMTGAPYSPLRQTKINTRLRRWNHENGTSHRVVYTPFGSNSFKGELIFNYLPVNKKAQTDRDKRRAMQDYTGVEDGESFENVHNPKTEADYQEGIISETELDVGRFEDGEFLPPSYFASPGSTKRGPKFQDYIAVKEQQLKALHKERNRLKDLIKNTTDKDAKITHRINLARARKSIETLRDVILHVTDLEILGQIEKYAESDMKTLERIFTQENPKLSDLRVAEKIIHIWQNAGDFSGDQPNVFYNEEELEEKDKALKDITDKFLQWKERANGFNVKLIELQEKIVAGEILSTHPEADINFDDPTDDISFLTKNLLDISETDNHILQTMATWVKDANFAAKQELDGVFSTLDELIEKAGITNFDIFQQTFGNNDSRKTGELVFRWTQSFFDWERKIQNKRRVATEKATSLNSTPKQVENMIRANREYIDSLRQNTVVFDARKLFPDADLYTSDTPPTEKEIADHKSELIDLLGEKAYQEYYDFSKKKIEEYKEDLAAVRSVAETENGSNQAEIERDVDAWIAKNSPYVYAEVMEKGYDKVTVNGQHVHPSNRFVRPIPKKTKDGQDTGFYDDKFTQIENDENLSNLYNYMFDMLQNLKYILPNEKVNFMNMNSIPTIKKKVLENIVGEDGTLAKGFGRLKETMVEAVRSDDLSTVTSPEDEKDFKFSMLQNNRERINNYIELKTTEYQTENDGKYPTSEEIEDWRKTAMNDIAEEKSFDLGRVMKAFASMAISYKHKSTIEDQMRIAQEIVNRGIERKLNAAGQGMTDKHGNIISSKGLNNLKKMLDDFMEIAYWGYPSNRPEGLGNKKVLTQKEKDYKKILDNNAEELKTLLTNKKISQDDYDTRLEVVTDQLETLGGIRTVSKYGDVLLKYIQVKGMGWNVFAAGANLGFGFMSNAIEASDGRNYSAKSFWKAQALTLNSVGRNLTFNKWDGISGNAKKIRVLMNYYDTLKESKNEIYEPSKTSLFKKVKDKIEWANPYSPQSRTEYLNQAPVMIAMLMDTMVKTKDGKEISLWDAYNIDGSVKEGVELDSFDEFKMKRQIDKLVKMNHGNYDPDTPLSVKRQFIGRALSQFRTWAFQGFHERFGKEKKDIQLTNRLTGKDFLMRKGRYRSYVSYYRADNTTLGVGATLNIALNLSKKLIGMHTNFNDMVKEGTFTEADAANMRKNMTEIVMWLGLTAFTLMLKASIDDDDEKGTLKMIVNLFINQASRLSTDILFYTNPVEFEKLTRNALPIFSIVVDSQKFLDSAWGLIRGEEDILQSGPNKGKSRTWRDIKKMIPGPVQAERIKSASSQIYNK